MLDFIISRISVLGTLPICNLNKNRAFFIGEFCFPFCVRCSAIMISIVLTIIFVSLFKIKTKKICIIFWILLIIPCLVDGIMQYFFNIESNNVKRLITGILCGIGIGNLTLLFINYISKKLEQYLIKK